MRALSLFLLSFPVFAADITATTGWTCSATLPASVTIDSGNDRKYVMLGIEEDNTPEMVLTTIGGQSPTETVSASLTTTTNDSNYDAYIFNESAIGSMSGTTVVGTDDGSTNGFWCYGTVEDADQAAIGSFVGTAQSATVNNITVTSTSNSGDYLVVAALRTNNTGSGSFSTWDGLTEVLDDPTGGGTDVGMAEGDGGTGGGDTLVVHSTAGTGDMSAVALVFDDAAGTAPIVRRRR
jgi:hypothetical protein